MNEKKAKRLRRALRRTGVNVAERRYKFMRKKKTKVGFLVLDESCGRASYKVAKRTMQAMA